MKVQLRLVCDNYTQQDTEPWHVDVTGTAAQFGRFAHKLLQEGIELTISPYMVTDNTVRVHFYGRGCSEIVIDLYKLRRFRPGSGITLWLTPALHAHRVQNALEVAG